MADLHTKSTKKAPGKPFEKGDKRAGRPKGTPNKFTTLKQSFLNAFEEIGGEAELANWAKLPRNRAVFYKMIATMLPKNIDLDVNAGVTIVWDKDLEGL